jgi:hypothetical protein
VPSLLMVELRAEQTTAIRWPGLRPALLYSVNYLLNGWRENAGGCVIGMEICV